MSRPQNGSSSSNTAASIGSSSPMKLRELSSSRVGSGLLSSSQGLASPLSQEQGQKSGVAGLSSPTPASISNMANAAENSIRVRGQIAATNEGLTRASSDGQGFRSSRQSDISHATNSSRDNQYDSRNSSKTLHAQSDHESGSSLSIHAGDQAATGGPSSSDSPTWLYFALQRANHAALEAAGIHGIGNVSSSSAPADANEGSNSWETRSTAFRHRALMEIERAEKLIQSKKNSILGAPQADKIILSHTTSETALLAHDTGNSADAVGTFMHNRSNVSPPQATVTSTGSRPRERSNSTSLAHHLSGNHGNAHEEALISPTRNPRRLRLHSHSLPSSPGIEYPQSEPSNSVPNVPSPAALRGLAEGVSNLLMPEDRVMYGRRKNTPRMGPGSPSVGSPCVVQEGSNGQAVVQGHSSPMLSANSIAYNASAHLDSPSSVSLKNPDEIERMRPPSLSLKGSMSASRESPVSSVTAGSSHAVAGSAAFFLETQGKLPERQEEDHGNGAGTPNWLQRVLDREALWREAKATGKLPPAMTGSQQSAQEEDQEQAVPKLLLLDSEIGASAATSNGTMLMLQLGRFGERVPEEGEPLLPPVGEFKAAAAAMWNKRVESMGGLAPLPKKKAKDKKKLRSAPMPEHGEVVFDRVKGIDCRKIVSGTSLADMLNRLGRKGGHEGLKQRLIHPAGAKSTQGVPSPSSAANSSRQDNGSPHCVTTDTTTRVISAVGTSRNCLPQSAASQDHGQSGSASNECMDEALSTGGYSSDAESGCTGAEDEEKSAVKSGQGSTLTKIQFADADCVSPPPESKSPSLGSARLRRRRHSSSLVDTYSPVQTSPSKGIAYDVVDPRALLLLPRKGHSDPDMVPSVLEDIHPSQWAKPPSCLEFESRFESGNLRKAIKVSDNEYDLILSCDLNTTGHTQWFFFRVRNMIRGASYKFNILNLEKPDSLYNHGLRPLAYSTRKWSSQNIGWHRSCSAIAYFANGIKRSRGTKVMSYHTLTFTYQVEYENDTVYFAHCYPYTYTDLGRDLTDFLGPLGDMENKICRRRLMCESLAGNPVECLTISDFTSSPQEIRKRRGILLSARIHPGESNASWMMRGVLKFLLGSSDLAKRARKSFLFKVIPILNTDGVVCGNYRCSLSGHDLNRRWKNPGSLLHPTVYHTKILLRRMLEDREVAAFVDLHGHSRKPNTFIYACDAKYWKDKDGPSPAPFMERLVPRLLEDAADGFSFKECTYSVKRSKESTGRVTGWREFGVCNSYTMEASFAGANFGSLEGQHFQPHHLEDLGKGLCVALYQAWGSQAAMKPGVTIHTRHIQFENDPDEDDVDAKRCWNEILNNDSLQKDGSSDSDTSSDDNVVEEPDTSTIAAGGDDGGVAALRKRVQALNAAAREARMQRIRKKKGKSGSSTPVPQSQESEKGNAATSSSTAKKVRTKSSLARPKSRTTAVRKSDGGSESDPGIPRVLRAVPARQFGLSIPHHSSDEIGSSGNASSQRRRAFNSMYLGQQQQQQQQPAVRERPAPPQQPVEWVSAPSTEMGLELPADEMMDSGRQGVRGGFGSSAPKRRGGMPARPSARGPPRPMQQAPSKHVTSYYGNGQVGHSSQHPSGYQGVSAQHHAVPGTTTSVADTDKSISTMMDWLRNQHLPPS